MQRDASYGTFGIYDTEKGARPYAFKLNDGSLVPPTPKPILAVSSENVAFAAAGESKEVTYTAENLGSNQVFAEISGDGAGQFSVGQIGAESITVTAAENTETTAKTATLTLYIAASEGGEHLAEATVALTQAGVPNENEITISKNSGLQASTIPTAMDDNISYVNSAANNYSDPIRIYKNNTFTITASQGSITTVIFDCNEDKSDYANAAEACTIKVDNGAAVNVSREGATITYTIAGSTSSIAFTASAGQVRIDSITVKYQL